MEEQHQSTPTTYKIINGTTNAFTRFPYEVIEVIHHPSHLGLLFSRDDLEENISSSPASNEGKGLPSNAAYTHYNN